MIFSTPFFPSLLKYGREITAELNRRNGPIVVKVLLSIDLSEILGVLMSIQVTHLIIEQKHENACALVWSKFTSGINPFIPFRGIRAMFVIRVTCGKHRPLTRLMPNARNAIQIKVIIRHRALSICHDSREANFLFTKC